MGKFKIRVDPKTGQNYLPRDVRGDGFVGDIEGVSSPVTVTLLKPNANLGEIYTSLGIARSDILLRIESAEEKAKMKASRASAKPMGRQGQGPPYPLFLKFSRKWLSDITGYSVGYLCRVATGHQSLSGAFVARCCFKLQETQDPAVFEFIKKESSYLVRRSISLWFRLRFGR